MAKDLITIDNLDDYICRNDGKLYMDGSKIITAGAKDELIKRHVELVYGDGCGHCGVSCAAACGGSATAADSYHGGDVEEILIAVAATLQKDYGITDPAQLKAMSLQVVKTLKENLAIDN